MGTARKIDIKNQLLSGSKALGNSNRGLKEVCSDLVNDFQRRGGKSAKQKLKDGTYLCSATIDRIASLEETEDGNQYRPNADTCERILKFFGAEMSFNEVIIKPRYTNKPKAETK